MVFSGQNDISEKFSKMYRVTNPKLKIFYLAPDLAKISAHSVALKNSAVKSLAKFA